MSACNHVTKQQMIVKCCNTTVCSRVWLCRW